MACDPQQVPTHRYVTTENIRAGDIILEEEPWIWSLTCLDEKSEKDSSDQPDHKVCHYCLLSPGKLLACSACKSAWYCGPACQRSDWALRHKHGDCRMQNAIRQIKISRACDNIKEKMHRHEFYSIIRRLLLSSGTKRLFSSKQRGQNGDPNSPLWNALMNSPSETDGWVEVNREQFVIEESEAHAELVRTISWEDLPNNLLEKRILPSLVVLGNHECWKKHLEDMKFPRTLTDGPNGVALGACLEMSKFPNNCQPNAVLINEGRLVRMIALEDIPNIDAVRLSRMHVWQKPRLERRSVNLRLILGFDCGCARCCAGDSGESFLFALRCPKWAALHGATNNTSSGCDGIVTGLRRTDIDHFANTELFERRFPADMVAVVDDPHSLPTEIMNQPAHERAECQKCHARYDKETMDAHILKMLRFMVEFDYQKVDYARSTSKAHKLTELVAGGEAEKYLFPVNYAYASAEYLMFCQCLATLNHDGRLGMKNLAWMQRHARRLLARFEGDGFGQHDLSQLFAAANLYSYSVQFLRRACRRFGGNELLTAAGNRGGRSKALEYEQTAELVTRLATTAMKKLKPLFIRE